MMAAMGTRLLLGSRNALSPSSLLPRSDLAWRSARGVAESQRAKAGAARRGLASFRGQRCVGREAGRRRVGVLDPLRRQLRACDSSDCPAGDAQPPAIEPQKTSLPSSAVELVSDPPAIQAGSFSRLQCPVPWDATDVGVTMITYLGVVHGPLGLGGLSLVANVLHQTVLAPQTKAVALVTLQLLELRGTVWLVQSTIQPFDYASHRIFQLQFSKVLKNRGWLPAVGVGLSFLFLVVAMSSLLESPANLQGLEHNKPLQELMEASPLARLSTFTVCCFITPYLEEYIYRGFLLTSLASFMPWPGAIIVSSLVFVLAHLPMAAGLYMIGLFIIGCVLGVSYTYTGNLATPFVIHSVYNAALLIAASGN